MLHLKIAGALAAFGLFGLTLPQMAAIPGPATGEARGVAMAITSGDQLQLKSRPADAAAHAGLNSMVCRSIYRLRVADIGFDCSKSDQATARAADLPSAIKIVAR